MQNNQHEYTEGSHIYKVYGVSTLQGCFCEMSLNMGYGFALEAPYTWVHFSKNMGCQFVLVTFLLVFSLQSQIKMCKVVFNKWGKWSLLGRKPLKLGAFFAKITSKHVFWDEALAAHPRQNQICVILIVPDIRLISLDRIAYFIAP